MNKALFRGLMLAMLGLGVIGGRADASPTVLSIGDLSPGVLRINVSGTPGASVVLEASANLLNWSVVTAAALDANGLFNFDEVSQAFASRFYRTRDTSGGGPVYSINVVGFMNTLLPPGYSLITNPWFTMDNSAGGLFPSATNGLSFFKPGASGWAAANYLNGWSNGGLSLGPGSGLFVLNPGSSSMILTLKGELLQGLLQNTLPAGYSLCGSLVPQSGNLETQLGFLAQDGDEVFLFNSAIGSYSVYDYFGGWDPTEPALSAGQAFWAQKALTEIWSRNFSTDFGGGGGFSVSLEAANFTVNQLNFFTFKPNPAFGRVLDVDGATPLSAGFSGQLYAGPTAAEGSLVAIGSPASFLGGAGAGYIRGGVVRVPFASGPQTVFVQLRCWEAARGASYEVAAANGSKLGKSAVVPLDTGGSLVPPPTMNTFASFPLSSLPPVITAQPASQSVVAGEDMLFSISATGTLPMGFAWRRNGTVVTNMVLESGSAVFKLSHVAAGDAGAYDVVITNSAAFAPGVQSSAAVLTVLADTDGDGMPDAYEVLHGLNPNSPADACSDPDGDGMTNLQESRAGTDPFDPVSRLALTGITLGPGNIVIVQYPAQAGSLIAVQVAPLPGGPWMPLAVPPIVVGGVMSIASPATGPRAFYRLAALSAGGIPRVYSLNTVGYENVQITAGSNLVTLRFSGQGNTIDQVIPAPPDGACVVKTDGTSNCYFGGGWDDPGMVLSPGESFALFSPLSFTLTFAGEALIPPAVESGPMGQTVSSGATVLFEAVASGSSPLFYQWELEGVAVPGATCPRLFLANVQSADLGNYRVVVSNVFGVVASGPAQLRFRAAPEAPVVLVDGNAVSEAVSAATNSAQLQFQTTFSNGHVYYTLDGGDPNSGLLYTGPFDVTHTVTIRAIAYSSDYLQAAESDAVALNLFTTPSIVQAPLSQLAALGAPVTFSVTASGTGPLRYQWLHDGVTVAGATNPALHVAAAQLSDAGNYAVAVSNDYGGVLSSAAILSLIAPPGLAAQPANTNAALGPPVTFCVNATGAGPLSYQWRKNGVNLRGQTDACLTIPSVQVEDGGSYSVAVANAVGTVTSADASLTVVVPQVPPGDDFSNRVEIAGSSGFAAGTNLFATREPGEPNHAGKPGSNSVWYTWQALADGIVTFGTAGSTFDTLLAVYTNDLALGAEPSLLNLVAVAGNDDQTDSFFSSLVRFNAKGGTDYQVAIDGFGGGQGSFVLSWGLDASGLSLPVITTQPLSQTVPLDSNATFSVTATGQGLSYQWFFNAEPLAGESNISLVLPSAQAQDVGVYSVWITNDQAQAIESEGAILEIGPSSGALTVDKFQDLFGVPPVPAPGLKAFGASLEGGALVSVAAGTLQTQIFSTTNSTTQALETNHCGAIGGASRWFQLQAASNGVFVIDTEGSTFDTVLAVYTALNLTSLRLVACNDDAEGGVPWSRVKFPATNGIVYAIAVDGVRGSEGIVRLNWGLGMAPTNLEGVLPLNLLARAGGSAMLEATPNGVPSPSYQWFHDQAILPEATNASIALTNLQSPAAGLYWVTLSNFVGLASNLVSQVQVDTSLTALSESAFDRETEGWGVASGAEAPVFHSAGGNPGGYVSARDLAAGVDWYWSAPAPYLGNQSAAYGGLLQFDLKQAEPPGQQEESDVVLTGGGLTLLYKASKYPGTSWTSYKVPLTEAAGWRKGSLGGAPPTQAEMLVTLASLSNISIRGKFSPLLDTGGLDNVMILAPPTNNVVVVTSRILGSRLLLEWPVSAAGFQLQTATTLLAPDWTDMPAGQVVAKGLTTMSLDLTNGGQYFRLRKL